MISLVQKKNHTISWRAFFRFENFLGGTVGLLACENGTCSTDSILLTRLVYL